MDRVEHLYEVTVVVTENPSRIDLAYPATAVSCADFVEEFIEFDESRIEVFEIVAGFVDPGLDEGVLVLRAAKGAVQGPFQKSGIRGRQDRRLRRSTSRGLSIAGVRWC
jgi:hypothetical protein